MKNQLKVLLAFATVSVSSLYGAIDIVSPPVPNPFTAVPPTDQWTTLTVGTATDATITTPELFDAKIIAAANAANIITVLGSSPTIPPSANAIARQNTGVNTGGTNFLQTRPTGNDYILLLAHLTNATGGPLNSVEISYEYSKGSAADATAETIKGLRAYSSLTGAPGTWTLVPGLSVDTVATYAAPQVLNTSILLPSPLPAGSPLYLLFADQNSTGTDASYHIRNFSAGPGLSVSLSASATASVRGPGVSLADPSDDTVSFSVTATASGTASPSGWVVTEPAGLAGTTGTYGTAKAFTNVPVSAFTNGTLQVKIADATTAAAQTSVNVLLQHVLGTNTVSNTPIYTFGAAVAGWTQDDATLTATQTAATQADHVLDSQVIDLSTTGFIQFEADLNAIAGASSGFETADSFALQLIIDGGTPVSALGTFDVNNSGRLTGLDNGNQTDELPGALDKDVDRPFHFTYLIPASASSVQIRIIGNSNSVAETFKVSNVKLVPAPASLYASVAGPVTVNNKGTVDPSDDEFSAPVTVAPVNLGASTGYHSDETPVRNGLYSAPNPVTFGPYKVTDGTKTVILTDNTNPAISSAPLVIAPSAPALTVSTPTNFVRHANNTVSFDVNITGTNGGPSYSVTGATPVTGNFGPGATTLTISAAYGVSTAAVTITDNSYAAATQTLNVNFPAIYVLGQKNFGAGATDVLSAPVEAPNTVWVNDPVLRTITMANGNIPAGSGLKTVSSEVINLSNVSGDVTFTANLHVRDLTTGFEAADVFEAYLIYNGDTANRISVIDPAQDTNASGVLEGAELAPAKNPAGTQDHDYVLTKVIPDSVNTVQLFITGLNDSTNEIMIVGSVLFSGGSVVPTTDADGDGVSDANEAIMGTDPNNASDVLRLAQAAGNPNQITFNSKGGKFYRVYSSTDLQTWSDAGLATIAGDNTAKLFNIPAPTPGQRRFFRLHVMGTDGNAGVWPPVYP